MMAKNNDYSNVLSFGAAVRWIAENHPSKPDLQHVRRSLARDVDKMLANEAIKSLSTFSYLVERDAEGDIRVWVNPALGRR